MAENTKLAIANGDTLSKSYPDGIRWDMDLPKTDLPHLMDESFLKFSKNYALDFYGRRMTYAELGDITRRVTKGLEQMGVKKGTKVGLCLPNTPYYPIFFLAALRLGATVVNFSPDYVKKNVPGSAGYTAQAEYLAGLKKMSDQIQDSGTQIMVTLDIPHFQDVIGRLKDRQLLSDIITCPVADMLPPVKKWGYKLFRSSEIAPKSKDPHNIQFSQLLNNNGFYNNAAIDPSTTALLQYTGGTTGIPKAAMLTHENLVANVSQIEEYYGAHPNKPDMPGLIRQGDGRVAAFIPYFHVFGMMVSMVMALRMGQEIIMIPNPRNIKDVLEAIKRGTPTILPSIPRLLQVLSESPEAKKYDFSSIETVMSGGAAISSGIRDSFEKAVGRPKVIKQGYGLSETSPVATSNPAYGFNEAASVGLPYPRTEIRIASPDEPEKALPLKDENGNPVIGEIQIRGPQVMKGYYNKPEETANVMTSDKFFKTGDLGYLDENYYLYIVDRIKRMVIINGMKIFPTQIEKSAGEHSSIAECVALAVPDSRSGEATKLLVRVKSGEKLDEKDLREFLASRLTALQIPKHIEFTENEILKTNVGKPDWKTLQDREKAKFESAQKPSAVPRPN